MPTNWATASKWIAVVLGAAAVSFALLSGYWQHERGQLIRERTQKLAQVQTRIDGLKARQIDLKARFDALLAESEKAPNDPEVRKALGARHLALVKEDEALRHDLEQVQRDLDAAKP
jgi:outer membrane murein-binding lipoprotein Lpp